MGVGLFPLQQGGYSKVDLVNSYYFKLLLATLYDLFVRGPKSKLYAHNRSFIPSRSKETKGPD